MRCIYLVLTIFTLSQQAFANTSSLKSIDESMSLKRLLKTISMAYTRGPEFNGFYWSDDFSFFIVESRDPRFVVVEKEAIIDHLVSMVENAKDWGSPEENEAIESNQVQAVQDLMEILGDQSFKQYTNESLHGGEHRSQTIYIGDHYQLWFEETWSD